MPKKITLLLQRPLSTLDGSQVPTHGIEWSASGYQTPPTAIIRVTRENAASEPGEGIRSLKREYLDDEVLIVDHTGANRSSTRRATRSSKAMKISNADSDHLGGDHDQHSARPHKGNKKRPVTGRERPMRRSPRKRPGQAVVHDQANTDRPRTRSRENEHQPQAEAHNATLESGSDIPVIDAEVHFQVLEELHKTKQDLEKAVNDRNEMQELLESRTSQLSVAQSFMSQTDSISVVDLTRMVESLNHDILQVAASFADTPKFRRTRRQTCMTGNQVEDFQRISQIAIGKYLTMALTKSKPFLDSAPSKKEGPFTLDPDTLIQISVQVCMVRCCHSIATTWTGIQAVGPDYDTMLSKIYNNLSHTEPIVARRWRSMTRAQIEITAEARKNMVEFVHKRLSNVLIVAGWPRDRCIQVSLGDAVSAVIDLAMRINTAIGQEIISMDIRPIEVPPEATFDSATMDDTFADSRRPAMTSAVGGSVVAGTTELGLQLLPMGGENVITGSKIYLKPKVCRVSVSKGVCSYA